MPKAPRGTEPRESRELTRRIDREITAQAVERVLQTASLGYGGVYDSEIYSTTYTEIYQQYGYADADRYRRAVLGCRDLRCDHHDAERDRTEWVYRRSGRWRYLMADGWEYEGNRPRRAWQYSYWYIEEARERRYAEAAEAREDNGGVPGAVGGGDGGG